MVEVCGINYEAGGTRILDDVSVAFHRGRFNMLLGPNGAGKSTLLRIAAGRLKPTAGEVKYEGDPVGAFSTETLARKRSVLSQHVELAFPLSVEEVVMMGRYPHYARVPAARDLSIVESALDLVDMREKREQPYPTLSGGERQKVQLARALAQIWNNGDSDGHRCLFLDEPTSSLDIHYQIQLLDLACDLLRHDCTLIAVVHDLNLAFQYGDVFWILSEGRLVHCADRAEEVPRELVEEVFRVSAHRIRDMETGRAVWQFGL
ncbi:MAG TPA: ATP-binding cassette domain-containing protein [Longimicrobiaceae bacterium]|nr:ATP-binding cassette domain-containing protein [Longimicrobiaceae bacterium]